MGDTQGKQSFTVLYKINSMNKTTITAKLTYTFEKTKKVTRNFMI